MSSAGYGEGIAPRESCVSLCFLVLFLSYVIHALHPSSMSRVQVDANGFVLIKVFVLQLL